MAPHVVHRQTSGSPKISIWSRQGAELRPQSCRGLQIGSVAATLKIESIVFPFWAAVFRWPFSF
jgi:hypothetical protein